MEAVIVNCVHPYATRVELVGISSAIHEALCEWMPEEMKSLLSMPADRHAIWDGTARGTKNKVKQKAEEWDGK